ncbi:hypothetical protein AZE42_04254 [Rhizopogon vesiculosus]|uniref:CHAT domain-containing protein n=1 Tax=Rhizopogon vesiculosus TaxID=180088 RepID=A0A1J8PSL7_9AGAM|nr:hypothetical protein AZE42_04254 [Rhizopogon vesiculosus]
MIPLLSFLFSFLVLLSSFFFFLLWNGNDSGQLTDSAPADTLSHTSQVVPDPLGGSLPLLGQESGHLPENPQEAEEIHLTDSRQIVITTIRASDLTLGLRRIPAGFYVMIQVDGAQWQTTLKHVEDLDVVTVEWNEQVVLPPEPSCKVRFRVYASFELGSMLGHGDLLRTFETSIAELLDRSENSRPIVFQPKMGEVVSPCTSLFIAVEQLVFSKTDVGALCPITVSTHNDMRNLMQLSDAGHCILGRFHRTQDFRDLDQSIMHFESARDLCPDGYPSRPAVLFNLAAARFISCQVKGTYLDLDIPISLFQEALDSHPTGHPDRPTTQLHLALALLSRFGTRGFQMDANAAEELLNEVLDVCHAKSHIYRSALLAINTHVLQTARSVDANALRAEGPVVPWSPEELASRVTLCLQSDDPHALDEVIFLHYEALEYYSTAHSQRSQLLGNLGAALYTRFERQGTAEDLDKAIAIQRDVLRLYPVGSSDRSRLLGNLGLALYTRFKHRGDDEDLDDGIEFHREALYFHPIGHPDRYASLVNLAIVLSTRFECRGNDKDFDEAFAFHREALELLPVGHPGRSKSLSNLGCALLIRFGNRGNDKDLDDGIAFHREALDLNPVDHPHRSSTLINLATSLSSRFKHRGADKDLDEAIAFYRESLHFHPVFHPDRSWSLIGLADGLYTRFQHRGNDQDLAEAIAFQREALDLRPVGHPERCKSLNSLASSLHRRFEHRGDDKDIDEAIIFYREALDLRPVGRSDRPMALSNLGAVLSTRFRHRGHDKDLDDAVELHREALDLHSVGHLQRPLSLNGLANGLYIRFQQRRGNDQDLDEAIACYREVLDLCPAGHPDRSSSLNNLAISLATLFKDRGNDKDLDEAISFNREALDLRSLAVGHPDRPLSLTGLANVLSTRFKSEQGCDDKDLDEAISCYREALDLRPIGHPIRPEALSNLATALTTCFEHRSNDKDLHDALANARSALSLFAAHDPRKHIVHGVLSTIYLLFHQSRFHCTGEDNDYLNTAMDHFKAAAELVSSGLLYRLQASLTWVSHAKQYTHSTLLEAHTTSIQLLDAYMSATASVSSRHQSMKLFPRTLAIDAASYALRVGDVSRAVELLEQGRTLIWTQMARFRTPVDSLLERGDHTQALVTKFRELSFLLDKPPAEHQEGTARVKAEAEATRYTRLVDDWKNAVEEIRGLEGFSRFLLPPLFSDLQDAARDGPIIILIATTLSCDAIIILQQHSPVNLRLGTSLEKLRHLVNTLQRTVKRNAGPEEKQTKLTEALRELWVDVVSPVVKKLVRFSLPGSRIWWCPTSFFNFLPLHAAGEYRRDGTNLSKLYISSYTPSLTALKRARGIHDRSQPTPFAAIGQNHPAGFPFALDSVEPELDLVQSLLPSPSTVSFTKVTSMESTKYIALKTLRSNRWLHFACHGTQNFEEPFNSAFLMRDKPLTLLNITQTDLSRHEFAFLSACETAVGDMQTPDEVIHLAAGLQFAGVRSVIGTFWSVEDSTVRHLVEAFYKNFCGDGKMNSRRAALALHRAVQSLATNKDISLD